jgi:hypothetical protein
LSLEAEEESKVPRMNNMAAKVWDEDHILGNTRTERSKDSAFRPGVKGVVKCVVK